MVVENLILGLMGGAVGVGLGAALVQWLLRVSMPDTMPDIAIAATVNPMTVVATLAAAVVTVALTPLTAWRRLSRLDIPSTLRVVE
jgi:putative ABC transport system permease protein